MANYFTSMQMQTDDVLNVESVFAVSSSDHFEVNSPLVECAFGSTEQLSPVYNNLKLLSSDSAFNLSLEWSLFKPNSKRCAEKVSPFLYSSIIIIMLHCRLIFSCLKVSENLLTSSSTRPLTSMQSPSTLYPLSTLLLGPL